MKAKQRKQAIRDVFEEVARSPKNLVPILRQRGIYTLEDEQRLAISGMCQEIRDALKEPGTLGSPVGIRGAVPVPPPTQSKLAEFNDDFEEDENETIWKSPRDCDHDEICRVIAADCARLHRDYDSIVRMRDYCLERFGRAPDITQLLESEIA